MILNIQIAFCIISVLIFLCVVGSGVAHYFWLRKERKRAIKEFEDVVERARKDLGKNDGT